MFKVAVAGQEEESGTAVCCLCMFFSIPVLYRITIQ